MGTYTVCIYCIAALDIRPERLLSVLLKYSLVLDLCTWLASTLQGLLTKMVQAIL